MKKRKSKDTLDGVDDSQSLIPAGMKWMFDMGLVDTEVILNNAMLLCFMASNKVKHVTFDISKQKRYLLITLFLTRVSMLFASKTKIASKIQLLLSKLNEHYDISIKFAIHKK